MLARSVALGLVLAGCVGPIAHEGVAPAPPPDLSIYASCAWTFSDGSIPACSPRHGDGTTMRVTPLPTVPSGWFCRLWSEDDEGWPDWRVYVRPYEDPKTGQPDPLHIQLGIWWRFTQDVSTVRGALRLVEVEGSPTIQWEGGRTGFVALPWPAPARDPLFTGVLLPGQPNVTAAGIDVEQWEPFWHLHDTDVSWPRFWPIAEVMAGEPLFLPVHGSQWDGDSRNRAGAAHWGTAIEDFWSDEAANGFDFRLSHRGFSIHGHMADALDPVWLRCSCHTSLIASLLDVFCLLPSAFGQVGNVGLKSDLPLAR